MVYLKNGKDNRVKYKHNKHNFSNIIQTSTSTIICIYITDIIGSYTTRNLNYLYILNLIIFL